MEEKLFIKGFLKGLFDFEKGKSQTEPIKTSPFVEPPTGEVPQAMVATKSTKPKTAAYLNRKKGRIAHPDKLGHLSIIIECIQRRGEVAPGDMARELGLPKSTLVYNLNRLLAICQGVQKIRYRDVPPDYVVGKLLGGKRVERVGAGKYVRYPLVELPQQEGPK